MGGKHTKCCCGETPCPEFYYCLAVGKARNCEAVEAAETYKMATELPEPDLGTGPDICCDDIWGSFMSFGNVALIQTDTCIWTNEEPPEFCGGTLTLHIVSASEAVLTWDLGDGHSIVWKSTASYNPLCVSRFVYSAADSEPPDDCKWFSELCLTPINYCCIDVKYPERVYMSIDQTGFCPCAEDTHPGMFLDLVYYDPSDALLDGEVRAKWVGEFEPGSCGTLVRPELTCTYTDVNGYVFFLSWDFGGALCSPDQQQIDDPDADGECGVFVLVFDSITSVSDCCGGAFADWVVTITE